MRSDSDIRQAVEIKLKYALDLDDTDVAVKVHNGVVTLTGFVHNDIEKLRAEIAVKQLAGVAAIANDIEVCEVGEAIATDPQIAQSTLHALRIEVPLSWEQIKPIVRRGCVTLEGTVSRPYELRRAEEAVRAVQGVSSVHNALCIEEVLP
ncbi:MAG TPA: BON domain-containing protein [Steroidobacteraceae bacterium]